MNVGIDVIHPGEGNEVMLAGFVGTLRQFDVGTLHVVDDSNRSSVQANNFHVFLDVVLHGLSPCC